MGKRRVKTVHKCLNSQLYVEAEIATGEDGNERSIECLSLIDAACYDVVREERCNIHM